MRRNRFAAQVLPLLWRLATRAHTTPCRNYDGRCCHRVLSLASYWFMPRCVVVQFDSLRGIVPYFCACAVFRG
jgi:hypothetical protein